MNLFRIPEPYYNNNIKIAEHFNLSEFACPCCGRVMLDKRILDYLIEVRQRFGAPVIVTSGYRCELHNLHIGGREDSKHLVGQAVDITKRLTDDLKKFREAVIQTSWEHPIEVVYERDHYHIEVQDQNP